MKTDRIIALEKLQEKIEEKQKEINGFELNPDDFESMWDECLDETEGTFMGYNASYILKQVDFIAYRCGLLDYVDNLDVSESSKYCELEESLESLEDELSDLKSDYLSEIEEEIEELEEESRLNSSLIGQLNQEYNYIEEHF